MVSWNRFPHNVNLDSPAIAGSGKTILTYGKYIASVVTMFRSIAIDFLKQILDNKSGLVYTYFDYNDKATQTALNVLGSILRQLLEQLQPIQWPENTISDLDAMRRQPLNSSHIRQITELIRRCTEKLSTIYFIFDAFDECISSMAPRWKLLRMISTCRHNGQKIKNLITSRPHVSILGKGLDPVEMMTIEAHDSDIEAYIRTNIEHDGRITLTMQDLIVERLVASAKGMYVAH